MRCLNHSDSEAEGSCVICGNFFCGACLDEVGEKRICLDCLEAMAHSSLKQDNAGFLTTRMIFAGALLVLFGFAYAIETAFLLGGFAQGILVSRAHEPVIGALASILVAGAKTLACFAIGYGVLMGRGWSNLLGIAVSAVQAVFSLYSLIFSQNIADFLMLIGSIAVFVLLVFSKEDFDAFYDEEKGALLEEELQGTE